MLQTDMQQTKPNRDSEAITPPIAPVSVPEMFIGGLVTVATMGEVKIDTGTPVGTAEQRIM